MIERGLLLGGQIVPGTSDVLRRPDAWWADGSEDTRPRKGAIVSVHTQHWTAGHPRTTDAGPRVYRAMIARKRADGTPLDVAVNFVVGWDGSLWQLADVLTACVHVGDRECIRRSVSTEHCWPGTRRMAERLGYREGPWRTVRVGGRSVEIMEPSAELLAASLRLSEMLASIDHPRVRIPRFVPESNARQPLAAVRKWHGANEHGQHQSTKQKIDCVGVLNDNLARAGWTRA